MVRVLLLADTHLGYDLPTRPRVERARRGPDFFACCERALEPARRGEVDLVVHAGDLLYRSRVGASLVAAALEPLLRVADAGVPVVLVPGNHERSRLPYPLLAAHRDFHLLERPRSVTLSVRGASVTVCGFPCERDDVRAVLAARLAEAAPPPADVRLLCLHQTVEGATVGPAEFVFRSGPDVIPGRAVPGGFAAVLAGHIHRHQVLARDLAGRPLAAPVLYPGSTERTSFAERDETKGFLVLELESDPLRGGRLAGWEFRDLPARPMRVVDVAAAALSVTALAERIAAALARQPADAVVQLRVAGELAPGAEAALRVETLRRLHPPTMIVELRLPGGGGRLPRAG
jgi:DNA repair exonuclease SbcCD nuclease subunit